MDENLNGYIKYEEDIYYKHDSDNKQWRVVDNPNELEWLYICNSEIYNQNQAIENFIKTKSDDQTS